MVSRAWQMSVDSLVSVGISGSAVLLLELLAALTSWLSWTLPSPAEHKLASRVCQRAECCGEQPDLVRQAVTGLNPLCRVMKRHLFMKVYGAFIHSFDFKVLGPTMTIGPVV